MGHPQLGHPQLGHPQLGHPQLGHPQLGHPQLSRRARAGRPSEPPLLVWVRLRDASPRALREVDRIVRASIALADEEGPTWLSMRHLATALATGTTSLYRYVKGKDELLELMVDAVNGEAPSPTERIPTGPTGDWRADLRLIARGRRQQFLAHPWLASQATSRLALGPNTLRAAEFASAVVAQLSADATVAGSILSTILGFVHGAVADELGELEAQRRTGVTEDQWRAQLAPYVRSVIDGGSYPNFAKVVIKAEDLSYEQQFEFGLARLLDGIEAFVSQEPTSR
jgi:AcrR family transcriptional regulator